MTKYIFIDTNDVFDSSQKNFFGNQLELLNFSKYASIMVPDGVIIEREEQIRREFKKQNEKFLNTLLSLFTTNFDIEKKIKELKKEIKCKYTIIELKDTSVLHKIKELAFKYEAPFGKDEDEKSEKPSDKGFKDCYIYFTVLEFIKSNPGNEYFMWTNDKKLIQAFENHGDITVVKDFSEFKNLILQIDDYQKQQIADIFKTTSDNVSCTTIENNVNENKVLGITVKDNSGQEHNFRFEIDNGEIIDYIDEDFVLGSEYSIEDTIDFFINSGSFQETHLGVHRLRSILQYLYNDELLKILHAAIDNRQISQIISDDDIFNFILLIYKSKHNILDDDLASKYQDIITEIETMKDTDELPF